MNKKKIEKITKLLNDIIDVSWLIDKMDIKNFVKNIENKTNITESKKSINSKKHEFVWKVVDLFINTKIFSSAKSIVEFSINELNLKFDVPNTTLFKRNKKEVIGHISVAIIKEPNDKIENFLEILSSIDTEKIKTEEEFKNSWSNLIRNIL